MTNRNVSASRGIITTWTLQRHTADPSMQTSIHAIPCIATPDDLVRSMGGKTKTILDSVSPASEPQRNNVNNQSTRVVVASETIILKQCKPPIHHVVTPSVSIILKQCNKQSTSVARVLWQQQPDIANNHFSVWSYDSEPRMRPYNSIPLGCRTVQRVRESSGNMKSHR